MLCSGAFGPLTFWVTEIKNIEEQDRVGVLVRGNLRTDRQKVFDNLCQKVTELFGEWQSLIGSCVTFNGDKRMLCTSKQATHLWRYMACYGVICCHLISLGYMK